MNNFKLGFGLMRLPKLEDGSFDIDQIKKMVDLFIENGGEYFDTAFAYPGSEETTKITLVDRYPRERYKLASKLLCSDDIKDEETAKNEIYITLQRTGASYIDYYLLHALQRSNYKKYDDFHLWDYVKELKDKGLIKHYGFSFHGDPELLEELLSKHPDVEFVQLQINYADWENPGVLSRVHYEICKKHGKKVTIMEPVKGGILANPINEVKELFNSYNPNLSYSSWAVRYLLDIDNIFVILSGMSSLEQMQDNLNTINNLGHLNEEEKEIVKKAQILLNEDKKIACTGCRYCVKGCPMNIPIPDIFTVYNRKDGSPLFRTQREYKNVTINKGVASDCIECGQCEGACPQHLPIIDLLKKCQDYE